MIEKDRPGSEFLQEQPLAEAQLSQRLNHLAVRPKLAPVQLLDGSLQQIGVLLQASTGFHQQHGWIRRDRPAEQLMHRGGDQLVGGHEATRQLRRQQCPFASLHTPASTFSSSATLTTRPASLKPSI